MSEKKTCFVVMGFGEKTDLATGRLLNLDASYKHVIKPAVESVGLTCIRADEIPHAGVIDVPMYEQLLNANVVIADLSTANVNAFYELGVRHALRPYTTLIISESQLKFPFDVNHIAIRTYEHLGKDIGYGEAERFKGELAGALRQLLARPESDRRDSPVYTFIAQLSPPFVRTQAEAAATVASILPGAEAAVPSAANTPASGGDVTVRALMDQFAALKTQGQFGSAREVMKIVATLRPGDPFVVQQLSLVTYKAKQPDVVTALGDARSILEALHPRISNDPETLGLWGAIHKRLWEENHERTDLNESIQAYEKGFYVKNDYYNGINLAFLLNVRASLSDPANAVADWVAANRVRRRVLDICEAAKQKQAATDDEPYWIEATKAEAWLGLGEKTKYEDSLAVARTKSTAGWMNASTDEQLEKLRGLLAASPLRFLSQEASVSNSDTA